MTRYLLAEILKAFVLSFCVLMGVALIVTAFQALHRFNLLELGFLARILPSLVVRSASLTLPIALLFSTTFTLGRWSSDNEITALKACGVHLSRLVLPILAIGVALSGGAFYLAEVMVPESYVDQDAMLRRALKSLLQSKLTAGATTIDYFQGYRISYTGIADGEFKDLVIHRLNGAKVSEEILARSGRAELDEETGRIRFTLERGSISRVSNDSSRPDEWKGTFEKQEIDIELPREGKSRRTKPRYLRSRELWEEHAEMERVIARNRKALSVLENRAQLEMNEENHQQVVMERISVEKEIRRDGIRQRELATEYHLRIAFSFLSVLVVLVGAPLGILIRHGNRLVAFGVSTLLVFVVYYLPLLLGRNLAENGSLPPVIAAWLGNVAFAAIGAVLLWRTFRR